MCSDSERTVGTAQPAKRASLVLLATFYVVNLRAVRGRLGEATLPQNQMRLPRVK
jgi:hypothetical protein